MREIKFRFWNKVKKKMSHAYGLGVIWEYLCAEWDAFDWKDVVKRQYTGLQDSHGTEIYEGDITEGSCYSGREIDERFVIVWNDDPGPTWGAEVIIHPRKSPGWIYGNTNFALTRHKVIGNTYENPELLT